MIRKVGGAKENNGNYRSKIGCLWAMFSARFPQSKSSLSVVGSLAESPVSAAGPFSYKERDN